MTTATQTERRTVVISRSPPRRLLAPLRFRSFKTGPDRLVWEACWQPVLALLEDGWRLVAVTVDWGPALPMTERWRVETIRELTGCYDGCGVRETAGDPGRGRTVVEMVRNGYAFGEESGRGGRLAWVWGDEMEPSPLYEELARRRGY